MKKIMRKNNFNFISILKLKLDLCGEEFSTEKIA